MTPLMRENWQFHGVVEGVAHLSASLAHQYYTLAGNKLTACDGAGNPEPAGSEVTHRLPVAVERAVRRVLERHTEIT